MTWWERAAGSVGVLPSLLVAVGLTLVTLAGHSWSIRSVHASDETAQASFARGLYLGLIGHLFLLALAMDREWALPPWPVFAALTAITLGTSAAALWSRVATMHAAGTIAAACVVTAWSASCRKRGVGADRRAGRCRRQRLARSSWLPLAGRFTNRPASLMAARAAVCVGELSLIAAVDCGATMPPFPVLLIAHVVNTCVLLTLTTVHRWSLGGSRLLLSPAWLTWVLQWQTRSDLEVHLATVAGGVGCFLRGFCGVPLRSRPSCAGEPRSVSGGDAGERDGVLRRPHGVRGRRARVDDRRHSVVEGAVLALLLGPLLGLEAAGQARPGPARARRRRRARVRHRRDSAAARGAVDHDRLGARGAALAWLYKRIPHRGLLYSAVALSARSSSGSRSTRTCSSTSRAARCGSSTGISTRIWCARPRDVRRGAVPVEDRRRLVRAPACRRVLPGAGVVLLFLLLNIEIADFYSDGAGDHVRLRRQRRAGPHIHDRLADLRHGAARGRHRPPQPAARVAAVALIAVTTFKGFLYDLGSLEGLRGWRRSSGWRLRSRSSRWRCRSSSSRPGTRHEAGDTRPAASGLALVALGGLAQSAPDATYKRPVAPSVRGRSGWPSMPRCSLAARRSELRRRERL